MNANALFRLDRLFDVSPKWLSDAFVRLPRDPYIPEGYRYRRLSRFSIANGTLTKLPHEAYVQDTTRGYNTLLGEVERWFDEIEPEIVGSPEFRGLSDRFLTLSGIDDKAVALNVHFIRNVCEAGRPGYPAPEGIHRDGFDYLGILCVAAERVEGAETSLHLSRDDDSVFRKELAPGEILLIDDAKLLHYTSPIHSSADGMGYRDVVILTANVT